MNLTWVGADGEGSESPEPTGASTSGGPFGAACSSERHKGPQESYRHGEEAMK